MAITTKTITGKIVIPGTTTGIRADVTATPMTTDHALTFPADDTISWGPVTGRTNGAGVLPDSFKIPTSQAETAVMWRFVAEPADKRAGLAPWTMGYYQITGTGTVDLADLVEIDVTVIDPGTIVSVQALVTAAELAEDNAAASATTASTAATTATTKAGEASASATAASNSATQAALNADGLDVGTVTNLAPGTPPTASITGTAPDRVINFGIPAGLADDASMTAVAANPASAFRGELSATFVSAVVARGTGIDYTGGADSAAALQAKLTSAVTLGAQARVLTGTLRTTAELTHSSGSLVLRGDPGATIKANHSGRVIYVSPAAEAAGGTSAAITAGDSTITVTGAAWTVDQHAGKWVQVEDPGFAGTTRRVLSNTADTLTLEHPCGKTMTSGKVVNFYTPIPLVDLADITLDRASGSGAQIVVMFAADVRLKNVRALNGGGNGISLYHCDRVRSMDSQATDCDTFGMFIYNCDDVRVYNPTVKNWGSSYAVQFKDCRDAKMVNPRAVGNRTTGENAFNLKCSGLNPSYDCEIVGGWATGSTQADIEFTTISTEGSYFSARNFKATGTVSYKSAGAGFSVTTDGGSTPSDFTWRDCVAEQSALNGFTSPIPRHRVINCVARLCQYEGLNITGPDVLVEGGIWQDNVQSYAGGGASTRSSEILLDAGALRTRILHPTFRRTAAGQAIRAVREVVGADFTAIRDPKIIEEVVAYTRDYTLTGANSKATGASTLDSFAGTPTIVKQPLVAGVVEVTAILDFPSIAAAGMAEINVTVTGAVANDPVVLGPPNGLTAGLVPFGFVNSTNTVRVRLTNITAAAIDPASAIWKIRVLKA